MINSITKLILLVLVVVAAIFLWEQGKNLFSFGKNFQSSHTLVLQETQKLGKMELSKMYFKDVVEHEMQVDFLPNPKVLLIVQGEAIGCIDLSKIQTTDLVTKTDSLLITLPAAEVCVFKVDHSRSRIYDASLTFVNQEAMIGQAYKQAEAKIKQSALEMGILKQTKDNANLMLKPLFEQISGKKVRFI